MTISKISFNNNALFIIDSPIGKLPKEITAPIVKLPKEITALICSYLDKIGTVQLASTCHSLGFLASNDPSAASLWNLFLRKDFSGSYTVPKSETENFPLYKRLKTVADNMKAGTYRLQTLSGHEWPITCMKILNGMLISGSIDNTIKIWDLSTGQLLQTLSGHEWPITCMKTLNGKLISGSCDWMIKIWDLSTGQLLQTLSGHQRAIHCMKILDGKLISGSDDGTIKIWDLITGQLIQTLSGHERWIKCMKTLDDTLISGSGDETIKIWDLSTGQPLMTLSGHQDSITCMKILDGKLISGSDDGTIKIWDLSTRQLLQTLNGHKDMITCMMIRGGKLISASRDRTIKIWDLSTGQLLLTLNGHENWITCLGILGGKLISASWDCTIMIWDLSTGQLLQTLSGHEKWIKCMKTLDGTLISGSHDNTIKVWDFNPLPLPPAVQEVPKHNLEILEQMPHAESTSQPILQCLGIITDTDYSELLGCNPGNKDLNLRGIFTLEDLNIICPPSLEIQELSIDLLPSNESSDFRKPQVDANRNRLGLSDLSNKLCNKMLDAISTMKQEAKNCGKILYEGYDLWEEFELELRNFRIELETIEIKCKRIPREIIKTFSGDSYAKLVNQLNELIKKFHEVDRKYRIAKLRAYIHQEDPLGVWKILKEKERGILTLNDFQKKFSCTLRELFCMKEFIENRKL